MPGPWEQFPGDNAPPTPGDLCEASLQGLRELDGEIASLNSVWEDVFVFLSGESTEATFKTHTHTHTHTPRTQVISFVLFETRHLISSAAHLFRESRKHTACEAL